MKITVATLTSSSVTITVLVIIIIIIIIHDILTYPHYHHLDASGRQKKNEKTVLTAFRAPRQAGSAWRSEGLRPLLSWNLAREAFGGWTVLGEVFWVSGFRV